MHTYLLCTMYDVCVFYTGEALNGPVAIIVKDNYYYHCNFIVMKTRTHHFFLPLEKTPACCLVS